MEHGYSSTEVCRLVGITYRQLDYWCRQGFVPGMNREIGSGCQRVFSDDQLQAVRRVAGIMNEIEMLKGELDALRQPVTRDVSRRTFTLRELARTG